MKVTKVWIHSYSSKSLRGFADVQFDGYMTIKGFKIFEREDGLVVSTPQRKDDKGKVDDNGQPIYYNILTINRDTQEGEAFYGHISEEVLNAYHATTSKQDDDQDDDIPF